MMRKWILSGLIMALMFVNVQDAKGAWDYISVEDLYQRLLENYGKIKDMKYVYAGYVNYPREGVYEPKLICTNNVYYKAPRIFMMEAFQNKYLRGLLKDKDEWVRQADTGKIAYEKYREAAFTRKPEDPSFADRMIEFFRKYEVASIVGNPEPGIFVIKADPRDPNFRAPFDPWKPEPDWSGQYGMNVEITVDAQRGVVKKMLFYDPRNQGTNETGRILWDKIQEVAPGIYFPSFMEDITYTYNRNLPLEKRREVRQTRITRYEVKDIQVNTGLKDVEFKP